MNKFLKLCRSVAPEYYKRKSIIKEINDMSLYLERCAIEIKTRELLDDQFDKWPLIIESANNFYKLAYLRVRSLKEPQEMLGGMKILSNKLDALLNYSYDYHDKNLRIQYDYGMWRQYKLDVLDIEKLLQNKNLHMGFILSSFCLEVNKIIPTIEERHITEIEQHLQYYNTYTPINPVEDFLLKRALSTENPSEFQRIVGFYKKDETRYLDFLKLLKNNGRDVTELISINNIPFNIPLLVQNTAALSNDSLTDKIQKSLSIILKLAPEKQVLVEKATKDLQKLTSHWQASEHLDKSVRDSIKSSLLAIDESLTKEIELCQDNLKKDSEIIKRHYKAV